MKKTLFAIVAASALVATAAPALAQPYGGPDRNDRRYEDNRGGRGDVGERADRLEQRIDRAVRTGGMSQGAANYILNELRETKRLTVRYRRDGAFTRTERAAIDARYDKLEARVARDLPQRGYRR